MIKRCECCGMWRFRNRDCNYCAVFDNYRTLDVRAGNRYS